MKSKQNRQVMIFLRTENLELLQDDLRCMNLYSYPEEEKTISDLINFIVNRHYIKYYLE